MKFSTFSTLTASALLLAFTSSTAFAAQTPGYKGDYKNEAPCPIPPTLQDGFYLGGLAGYDSYRIRESISNIGEYSIATSTTGWMGGLFGGYGKYYGNYYMGGELLADYSGGNQVIFSMVDDDGDTATQKFKTKGTLGLSFLPGLKLNDTSLGYLRLGYIWTQFESRIQGNDSGAVFSNRKNSTKGGVDLGIGIETLAYRNWSIRTEFNHVWYNSFKYTAAPASARFYPSNNQFTLGAIYHFV